MKLEVIFKSPQVISAEFKAARTTVFVTVQAKMFLGEIKCSKFTADFAGDIFVRTKAGGRLICLLVLHSGTVAYDVSFATRLARNLARVGNLDE